MNAFYVITGKAHTVSNCEMLSECWNVAIVAIFWKGVFIAYIALFSDPMAFTVHCTCFSIMQVLYIYIIYIYMKPVSDFCGSCATAMTYCKTLLVAAWCVRQDRKVFLDRLCIAQHDAELKALGILGLASFLRHSKEMTVLWSENWISRLWCVYDSRSDDVCF